MKKRPITLIEVVIFCFLAAIVLGTVLYFFTQSAIVERKIQNIKEQVYTEQTLELKLHNIFSRLLPSSAIENGIQKSSFFTVKEKSKKNISLYFFYESGIDLSPDFSGPLFGLLKLEKDKLILITWPSSFNNETISILTRRQELLDKVKGIEFEFYTKNENTNNLEMKSSWPKENEKMPLMFLLKITKDKENKGEKEGKEEKISFPFFISSKENVVKYDEKKSP